VNRFLGGWENALKAPPAAAISCWNFSRASGVVGGASQVGVQMNALGALRSNRLPLPARNAQFATSIERFASLEHIGRHCLATPILGH
jgi:hypothetical protein